MEELLEIYKKDIEIILNPLGIYKRDKAMHIDSITQEVNKKFIKEKMVQVHAGNIDENVLNQALDELLPYLF